MRTHLFYPTDRQRREGSGTKTRGCPGCCGYTALHICALGPGRLSPADGISDRPAPGFWRVPWAGVLAQGCLGEQSEVGALLPGLLPEAVGWTGFCAMTAAPPGKPFTQPPPEPWPGLPPLGLPSGGPPTVAAGTTVSPLVSCTPAYTCAHGLSLKLSSGHPHECGGGCPLGA